MNDAFGNPIVIGNRYKCSNSGNQKWTSLCEGTASKILDGVHGQKITLTNLESEAFVHGVSTGKNPERGVTSVFPCHLFPVPTKSTK